ncbi:MAG: monooxygenase [Actinomycetota bacterium]
MRGSDLPVAVVGGSLGGLTAALLLRDLGCDVTVHERSTAELEARGAGIVVLPETSRYLVERVGLAPDAFTCSTQRLRYLGADGGVVHEEVRPYRYSGWRTIYAALLGAFGRDAYRLGSEVVELSGDHGEMTVHLAGGGAQTVGLVVGADGSASRCRGLFLPDLVPGYAGYVAWRGTVPESAVSARAREAFDDALVYEVIPRSHILVYPIPGDDGSTAPGERSLNFVWYRNYAAGVELDALMTDRDGVLRERTLPPGAVSDANVAEARAFARANLAPAIADLVEATERPFVQAIYDLEVPQMAFGRACLLGDAAFLLRPHIAAGTAKACADAWALAGAIEREQEVGCCVSCALRTYEESQLAVGRTALARTRRNGNRSQFEGTWDPADPTLAFGLTDPA